MKQYYFISGLPRSGSTLLSTILNQNPNFRAGISGPLLSHVRSLVEVGNAMQKSEVNYQRTRRIIKSCFDGFYEECERPVVFDTNRLWTNLLPQLNDLFPYTKVLCCVRDINWIIDSFERLHQKNPWAISSVFPSSADMHVYSRSQHLMADAGVVGLPYISLKSAMCGPYKNMLFFVEYEMMCKNPEGMMRAIYNFIGQPYYQHDFNNVEASYDEYDAELNMPGLHTTKKKVGWEPRNFVLPPDVLEKYSNMEVWRE
jgi:sulfotransferase